MSQALPKVLSAEQATAQMLHTSAQGQSSYPNLDEQMRYTKQLSTMLLSDLLGTERNKGGAIIESNMADMEKARARVQSSQNLLNAET